MLKDIIISFNKLDYFKYLILFIIIFITFRQFEIINSANIYSILFTMMLMYYFLNQKILYDFSKMEQINNNLLSVNIDKYKNLAQDIDVINCIVKLTDLVKINRVKFNSFVKHVDNFFLLYKKSFCNQDSRYHIYQLAKYEAKGALNDLLSFNIDIPSYRASNINLKTLSTEIISYHPHLNECINSFKDIFSKYLNEMENDINNEWLKGNINVGSMPIYPDEPDASVFGDIMYSKHYDIY